MQSQSPGRNKSGGRNAHAMNGQNSASVFEGEEERPVGSGLKPSAVMVSRVVIADGRVPPASR